MATLGTQKKQSLTDLLDGRDVIKDKYTTSDIKIKIRKIHGFFDKPVLRKANQEPLIKDPKHVKILSNLDVKTRSYKKFNNDLSNLKDKLQTQEERKHETLSQRASESEMKINEYTSKNCFFVPTENKLENK